MKANIRFRNRQVNTFVGMLVVAIAGSIATFYLLHVIWEVPFTAFASPTAYEIGSTL